VAIQIELNTFRAWINEESQLLYKPKAGTMPDKQSLVQEQTSSTVQLKA
jgi:hypothetical protein